MPTLIVTSPLLTVFNQPFDPLKAALGRPLAEVLQAISDGPPVVRPVSNHTQGKDGLEHTCKIVDGTGFSVLLGSGELGLWLRSGVIDLMVPRAAAAPIMMAAGKSLLRSDAGLGPRGTPVTFVSLSMDRPLDLVVPLAMLRLVVRLVP